MTGTLPGPGRSSDLRGTGREFIGSFCPGILPDAEICRQDMTGHSSPIVVRPVPFMCKLQDLYMILHDIYIYIYTYTTIIYIYIVHLYYAIRARNIG